MTGIFSSAKLAEVASRIHDVATARACLGKATEILAEAYGQLDELPSSAGLRDSARSYLDSGNAYAQRVYAQLPTDGARQRDELTAKQQLQVAEALRAANNGLDAVMEAAAVDYWDFPAAMLAVVEAVGRAIGSGVALAGQSALVLIWAFVRSSWWVLLIVLAAVYFVRRGILKAAAAAVTP